MSPKKNIGPKITEETHKFLSETFDNPNQGAQFLLEMIEHVGESEFYQKTMPNGFLEGLQYVLEAYPALLKRALAEVEGKFTREELMTMIDVFNAHRLTNKMAGEELWWTVAEGIKYDALDSKWGVDKDTVLDKIAKLTSFQKAALEIWANGFWYGGDPDKKLDMENQVAQLL